MDSSGAYVGLWSYASFKLELSDFALGLHLSLAGSRCDVHDDQAFHRAWSNDLEPTRPTWVGFTAAICLSDSNRGKQPRMGGEILEECILHYAAIPCSCIAVRHVVRRSGCVDLAASGEEDEDEESSTERDAQGRSARDATLAKLGDLTPSSSQRPLLEWSCHASEYRHVRRFA